MNETTPNFNIYLRDSLSGETDSIPIIVNSNTSVTELQRMIFSRTGIFIRNQQLMHNNVVLEREYQLQYYNIVENSVIDLNQIFEHPSDYIINWKAFIRLYREHVSIINNHHEHGICEPITDDYLIWRGTLNGPPNTPYEGGRFCFDTIFSENYPFKPPKVYFNNLIYHVAVNNIEFDYCNIYPEDTIIGNEWSPSYTIHNIMDFLYSLLESNDKPIHRCIPPNICNCVRRQPGIIKPDPSIERDYLNNRDNFNSKAREYTLLYAS